MRRLVGGLACFAACLGGALATHAQSETPAPPATPPIVLQAAHLFDGRTGKLISPGRIVVQGTKIESVGDDAPVPPGARVIDLGDATLMPGFIDAHTHLTYDYDAVWSDGFYHSMMRLPVEQSFHAARNARTTLQAGVTTVRDVGAGLH
jgi:imidazolonepropionase-like amidohydrolase